MITSIQNERIKEINKLKQKKHRHESGLFMIEGPHLIEEALKSDFELLYLIKSESYSLPKAFKSLECLTVSESVLLHLATTKQPQGILAVVKMTELKKNQGHLLLIDAIQDPGNLGTMIRTAASAGFGEVILGKGTVDLYNDKVIRSTQGALFNIRISQADLTEAMTDLKKDGVEIWAASLDEATYYHEKQVTNHTAIIIGNEGAGIQADILRMADASIKIPIYGEVESLNAGVAAGILMYYVQTSFAR